MKIVVAASDEQLDKLTGNRLQVEWLRVNDCTEFINHKTADAYFNLTDNTVLADYALLEKPVIINSVTRTLKELNAPANTIRINGWAGFLQRPCWEMAGILNEQAKSVFEKINIKIKQVADEPGLIAARVIAMIINEAYFTVADGVSTKDEIDTAMKLGTNYPYGPFEWAESIGSQNVLGLLQKLNLTDSRYQPSALLITEVNEKTQ